MVSDLKLDQQSTAQHSNLSSAAAIAGRARTKYDGSHPLTNLSRFQGDRLQPRCTAQGGHTPPVGLITAHISHQVHRIFLFSFRIQGNEPVFCSSSRSATVDYLRPLLQ
ncbi:hypothetical protein H9L39_01599 [Fusarium oxysporum f. sp. albedinis]|nr:hypothetical protein H9L39_01599 [Fusarium oxysporum f. sp. albedinis]